MENSIDAEELAEKIRLLYKYRYEEEKRLKKQIKEQKRKKRIKKKITIYLLYTILLTTNIKALKDSYIDYKNSITNIYTDNDLNLSEDELIKMVENLEEEFTVDNKKIEDYLLFNAIKENENLTAEDKEVFYHLYDMITENPYINREEIYNDLLCLKIIRTERPNNIRENVLGTYSEFYNEINIYEDKDNEVINHESVHALFTNSENINVIRFIKEGMTELLSKEYSSKDPFKINCYYYEIVTIKLLCEIIQPESILEYYSTGNITKVLQELAHYGKTTIEEAEKVLDNIETILLKNQECPVYVPYTEEASEIFLFLDTCVQNKKEEINYFTTENYEYNKIKLLTIFTEDLDLSESQILVIPKEENKAYFCKELKKTGENKTMKNYY